MAAVLKNSIKKKADCLYFLEEKERISYNEKGRMGNRNSNRKWKRQKCKEIKKLRFKEIKKRLKIINYDRME